MLTEFGTAIATIADRVGPAVVGIGTHHHLGSGVLIAPDLVLTNAHNVGHTTAVVLADGSIVEGERVGFDGAGDLAVLRLPEAQEAVVDWQPEDVTPAIGTPVVGLANPGGRGLRATLGFVAATDRSFRGPHGRRIHGGFEHTALAPPGSSGGPVVDASGRLLGINTRRLERGFYVAQTAGPEFAERVDALRTGKAPEQRRLGVVLAPSEVARKLRKSAGLDDVEGLLIRFVEEDSPAAAAGVREGDVLVAAGGRALTDPDSLHRVLASAGDELDLDLVRVNDRMTVTVRFGG